MPMASGAGGFVNDAAFQQRQDEANVAARAAGYSGVYTTDGVNFIPYTTTPSGGSSQNLLNQANALGGNTMANTNSAIWETDPYQGYLNQLGIGDVYQNQYQKWQMQQYNPTMAGYLTQSQLNPAGTGQVAPDFGQYLSQTGIQGTRAAAPGWMKQVSALTPEYQGSFWERIGEFANDLLQSVLGQKYGTPMAERMGKGFPGLQRSYLAAEGQPGAAGTFLDYLRQKYNL